MSECYLYPATGPSYESPKQPEYVRAVAAIQYYCNATPPSEMMLSAFARAKESLVTVLQVIGDIKRDPETLMRTYTYTCSNRWQSVYMRYRERVPGHPSMINAGPFGQIDIICTTGKTIDWNKPKISNGMYMVIPVASEYRPYHSFRIDRLAVGYYQRGKVVVVHPYDTNDSMGRFTEIMKNVLRSLHDSLPPDNALFQDPYAGLYAQFSEN
jgi:hypothetical protein